VLALRAADSSRDGTTCPGSRRVEGDGLVGGTGRLNDPFQGQCASRNATDGDPGIASIAATHSTAQRSLAVHSLNQKQAQRTAPGLLIVIGVWPR
jgi:hypothetical protein